MLMEKATCKLPQEEMSSIFQFTSSAANDNLTGDNNDHNQSSLPSLNISNEIPAGYD